MNILPIALTAAGAIPNIIGGIMSAVLAGKKLSGGRLRRHHKKAKRHHMKKGKGLARMKRRGGKVKRHHYKKKHVKRGSHKVGYPKGMGKMKRRYKMKGRGVVADTLGNIPLIGALLGPLAKAFGGKLKRMPKRNRKAAIRALIHRLRGKGLSPMYIRRPYVSSGCGLPSMGMIHSPHIGGRHGNQHRMSSTIRAILRRGGYGLSPMYIRRPYTGGRLAPAGINFKSPGSYLTPQLATAALIKKYPNMTMTGGTGLLYPAGGLVHRKGHLRKIKGRKQKVRVKPTVVGHGLLAPAGGYMPYGGHYGVYRR